MALSNTILQAMTFAFAYLLCFTIFRNRYGAIWGAIAFVVAFIVAWPVRVIAWAITFSDGSPTDAITNGMSRSFLFALLGPSIAIYMVRRRRVRGDV
jgi:hypothetical protein